MAIGHQTLAAQAELARLVLHVALISRQHLDLLLDLHHAGALGIGRGLGGAQALF